MARGKDPGLERRGAPGYFRITALTAAIRTTRVGKRLIIFIRPSRNNCLPRLRNTHGPLAVTGRYTFPRGLCDALHEQLSRTECRLNHGLALLEEVVHHCGDEPFIKREVSAIFPRRRREHGLHVPGSHRMKRDPARFDARLFRSALVNKASHQLIAALLEESHEVAS